MKTRVSLLIGLLLTIGSVCLAQEATASPSPKPKPVMSKAQIQRNLIASEKKLWEAWKNHDAKPFKSTLSADSVMIDGGGVSSKTDSLKMMADAACNVKSYGLDEIKFLWLDSNAVVMTYKATQDATCGGTALPGSVWASSTYVKRGSKWYAATHQETPVRP
jgi:hypothetical protein